MVLKDGVAVKAEDPKWKPARVQHRYLVLRKLGQGTYGKVQLAINKETNEEVAIKTIKKAKIENEEDMLRIRREIQIMSSIRHPHIIHINEVLETKQRIVLVMQYASGGELYDYLGCHHTLPEDEARRIFRQIASAIYYCHKNKICHRDLKLENILLDEEGNAQIADFGLSNIFDDRRRMNTFCGSPLYASPEIVKGTPYKGPEVDCWSLGVLLYTLIYGTMPFDGRNFKELVSQISEGRYEEPTNKSSASGLIRRLLTPEITKRATIFDVCIDRWVNQGCVEPLVKIAEKMTTEALLKTKKLGPPKMYSESTNEIKEKVINPPISIQQNKENIIVNGKMADLKDPQSEVSQKASLFEQMLKYDVNFVMNQLLSAVESSNTMISINENNTHSENLISALKPKNGENVGKVESAYVIPIFEVTSVMPKLIAKNTKNSNCEKSYQMCFSQNTTGNESQLLSTSENKNYKSKTNKKLSSNLNQPSSNTIDGNVAHNGVKHSNLANNFEKQNGINEDTVTTSKASNEKNQAKLLVSNENILPRLPSIKMKKPYENHLLFGSKKPFFRSKNHSLSLARIFSMKYEKLVLDALKVPERKQKPPGKITIPATFDPTTICEETPERKEIVLLFPTVSVSENKQKIEKKIDKIKKAALNMNLIRRSNTNNRLRIQKFLRSQAKKMQDLVCDEHRSLAGSMEYIDQINGFPTNLCPGSLNPFNMKHHNKKINFMNSNLSNPVNPFAFDISHGEKWKFFGSENILTEDKENLAIFSIAKSKSDIQFPTNYSEYNMTNSSYRSSYSSGYNSLSNTLSVPNSDCSLLRSASDSDGLNFFRNTPIMYANTDYFKCTDGNISEVHYEGENVKFEISFTQNESEELHKTSDGEKIKNFTNSKDLSQIVEMHVDNEDQDRSKSINCLNNKNKENYNIRRSISTTNCLNSQQICASDLQNIKRLLLTSSLINKKNNQVINNSNNGFKYQFPLDINVLGDRKVLEKDIEGYSFNEQLNCNDKKINLTWNEIKSMDPNEIFNNYLRLPQGKQQLLTLYQQNGGKCLSSPNLADLDVNKSINFKNGGISINGFHIRATENDDILDFAQLSQITNLQKSMKNFTQIRNGLQISDNEDEAFYDFPARYKYRAMSINDDSMISLESLLEYERKLSLPQGSLGKAPFLSKFLNDLERRDQLSSSFDNSSSPNQRSTQRKKFNPPNRSKLEKRSQSFLQLLALKRIQEAEKELEKVERNTRIEDEDESGSLLEALKTHGYKGVISQRFQNQDDDDAMQPLNLRNPRSQFLTRNYSPDLSYFHSMDYDTSPYLYSPYEDDDLDLEMLNGVTMQSLYEIYPGHRQKYPKQYIYDWLTANQNNEYSTTPRTEPTFEPEIPNTKKESKSPSYWSKESPTSFDEASSSESFEFPRDQVTNGTTNNELNPARYPLTDNGEFSNYVRKDRNKLLRTPSAPERYENYSKYASLDRNKSEDNEESSSYVRSERNPLLRTASAPEEEKEESVQDRIWRKSFYSRFNNSVLSRKERSSFLDTCDSRAGFRERSLTPFKLTSRDRLDRSGSSCRQSKRNSKRRSSGSSDRTWDSELSSSIKHIPLQRTETNTTITNEMEDTDPEH